MDPLSLAASIAGLVSLGDIVFKYALRYCKSVKDAPKEVNDLLNEIKDLTLLLHNLSMVAYDHGLQTQTNPQNPATAHKPHHLHECQQLLNQLEDGLSKFEQKSGLDKVQSRLKWPFTTSATKEMLQAIGRHKQTINIALGADSLTKLQICLSRHDETLKEIRELKVEVRKIQDIETKITLSQKRREVLSTFTKANPRLEFDNNKELRYPMTALWLTEGREFAEWLSNDEARIWCSGIPGAGKSVIAAAIIDVCLQRLLTSPNTAHESAYKILEAYHEELHPPNQLPGQLKVRRLIKVLHEMCEIFDRVYLIVDGLDECGNNTREAVDSLSKVSLQAAKKNINMALLSRDELLIREKIEQHFHWIEIEAHTEDVQLYVASEVDRLIHEKELRLKDFSLKDEIITELVKGAKGMFRWVACQLDHLCKLPTDGARRKALNRLPPTLPATYERILQAIDQLPSKKIVRNLLLLMMIKDAEFDSLALCEAISIEENSDRLDEDEIIDEEEILRWCGSLIRLLPQSMGKGKKFQFAHFTVQEFLESDCSDYPILKSYGISLKQAKKSLMQLSLRFLNFKNFGIRPQANHEGVVSIHQLHKARPFYKIASVCWWSYDLEETDGMSQDHLCALFRKTPNFYSWAVEVVSQVSLPEQSGDELQHDGMLQVISNTTRPDFTPLHMSSALGCIDICRQLIHDGAKMDFSRYGTPLHCAIGGLAVFDSHTGGRLQSKIHKLQPSPLKRRGIVDMLLKEGVQKNMRLNTPFQQSSLLSLALLATTDVYDLDIVADLIRHGIPVEEEDPQYFFDTCFNPWQDFFEPNQIRERYDNGAPVLNVLDALASIQLSTPQQMRAQIEREPYISLYDHAFDFAQSMGLEIKKSLIQSTMSGEVGGRDLPGLVSSALQNNDTDLLEKIYCPEGSKQIALFDQQRLGFSVLHTAIEHASWDCLELLLQWGFDPNARDEYGMAPIHMCFEDQGFEDGREILRVLLNHGSDSLALDDRGETVWHISAGQGMYWMLELLIQQKERDSALLAVSKSGNTPVCSALIQGIRETVELLLEFCDKREHWKCSEPIYLAAAKLGSAEVFQKLIDIGVQYVEIDENQGNPLHWISPGFDLKYIEILKSLFSLEQRRKSDSRTPFESLMLRTVTEASIPLRDISVAMALLPDDLVSSPERLGTLWLFLWAEVVPKAMSRPNSYALESLGELFTQLLEKGIASAYEEHFAGSALEPLAQYICRNTISRLGQLASKDPTLNPLPTYSGWNWLSQTFHLIADNSKHTDQLAKKTIMAQLLCEAIIHGDGNLAKLLLKLGVDCHILVGAINSFELACLPGVSKDEQLLKYFLEHATPEHLARVNPFNGLGPLHLTAGLPTWKKGQHASIDKLKYLLATGANPNLPSSRLPPMVYHIDRCSMETAEALLDAGADPWLRAPGSCDSVLIAIYSRNWTFLTKVSGHSTLKNHSPKWNQTWTASYRSGNWFRNANALHLAALVGGVDVVEFYLDKHLLTDLNARDSDGQTPMHYAVLAGRASVIQYLVKRGGDIHAESKSGMTPLNLAVREEHTECVRILLNHGAGQQVGHIDKFPFVPAYRSGNEAILSLLKEHLGGPSADGPIMNHKAERHMEFDLMLAIRHGNIGACQKLLDLGCPIDIEITPGKASGLEQSATPLMFAICERASVAIVKWLLDNNANVSAVSWNKLKRLYCDGFSAALRDSTFNPLIPVLVTKYLEERGKFLARQGNYLSVALASRNTQGLVILLDEFSKNHKDTDLYTMLNPKLDAMNPQGPLHIAARLNDLAAFKALVVAGADIEQLDYHGSSPLHIAAAANALSVAEYLLCSSARLNPISHHSYTPILNACLTASSQVIQLLLKSGASYQAVNDYGDNCLTLFVTPQPIRRGPPNINAFKALLDAGIDLFARNKFGLDAARSILISNTPIYLYYILSHFPRFLNNRSLSWAAIELPGGASTHNLCALSLSRHLRLIRPLLTSKEFLDLSDLSSPGRHTFFCSSVISGSVEAVRNFLKYGANIQHACPDHGTPLIAALTYRRFHIVKIIFLSDAKAFTDSFLATEVPFMECDEKIKRWLLVERHYEQPKLEEMSWNTNHVPIKGAGVVIAEVMPRK
ncbi:ankyrin repeat [Fusarium napiforme]|uniref:Ankyrin repeat n=1 Tax=Fusarium napiforme TaxID=42672 RepID=A0A8H5MNL0_9HYPO|nr:ankyrin repeat [Fusarium napiforme]